MNAHRQNLREAAVWEVQGAASLKDHQRQIRTLYRKAFARGVQTKAEAKMLQVAQLRLRHAEWIISMAHQYKMAHATTDADRAFYARSALLQMQLVKGMRPDLFA